LEGDRLCLAKICEDRSYKTLFFQHAKYHPADVSRSDIRQAFHKNGCPNLQSEIGVVLFTVLAYTSRQPNLRDTKLTRTKQTEPQSCCTSSRSALQI
jgi:hypothetical protein